MRATSAHTRALGMFDAASPLVARGVPIGDVLSGGGLFIYDPWIVYAAEHLNVTDPNMLIFGKVGQRKSTTAKCFVLRELAFGRQVRVIDKKGEYNRMARSLGEGNYTIVRLRPGGEERLNPLSDPEDRHELLKAVARAAMGRPLDEREPALLNAALDDVAATDPEPVLPRVLERLFHPTEQMAKEVATTTEGFAAEARDVAMALKPLCKGDLAGMFDAPTTPGIDFDRQMVVIDLSVVKDSRSLGILMSCATAVMQAQINRQRLRAQAAGVQPPKTILLIDEAWKVFEVPGIAEWLRDQYKLSRQIGQCNLAVVHRPSDLSAAGDQGSREQSLAEGLLEDCQTFVIFHLAGKQLRAAAELLELTVTEQHRIARLRAGQALWKVGDQRWVVQTAVSSLELPLVYTDENMRTELRDPS